jgi:hypothetical protein
MTPETMLCIQTAAQILLALTTAWTLWVLIGYARDTKSIAKNSSEQVENALIPFVALIEKEPGHSSRWSIKNQGKGPATNVSYKRYTGENEPTIMQDILPLAPSDHYDVGNDDVELTGAGGFVVQYESLSGKKYLTTVLKIDGKRKHTFVRVN